MIKTLRKLSRKGNFLNMIKKIYKIPVNIKHNDQKLKSFPLKLGTRQRSYYSPLKIFVMQ